MPPVGFELTISAGERPQTHALDGAVTGIDDCWKQPLEISLDFVTSLHFRTGVEQPLSLQTETNKPTVQRLNPKSSSMLFRS